MGIALTSLMVVERIALFEAEDDAPVGGDLDCSEAVQFALERVEPETGGIHVGHGRCGVQTAQDPTNLGDLVGRSAPAVALLGQTLQPPMPEAPYRHAGM
jgi:hypothetical protein